MKTFQIERQFTLSSYTSHGASGGGGGGGANVIALTMDFNHNASLVALGCSDGSVRVFDVQQNEQLMYWCVSSVKMVHVSVINLKFSFDDTYLYTLSSNGILTKWSALKAGNKYAEFILSQKSINFSGASHSFPKLFAIDSTNARFLLPCENGVQILTSTPEEGFKVSQKVSNWAGRAASCLDWAASANILTIVSGANSNSLTVRHMLAK